MYYLGQTFLVSVSVYQGRSCQENKRVCICILNYYRYIASEFIYVFHFTEQRPEALYYLVDWT
jgi:hypothetical protein